MNRTASAARIGALSVLLLIVVVAAAAWHQVRSHTLDVFQAAAQALLLLAQFPQAPRRIAALSPGRRMLVDIEEDPLQEGA